jgi:RNA polymerase primary sigma factor
MNVENFLKENAKFRMVFDQLTPREKKILRYRWGFSISKKPKTLQEVAKEFKVSKERIRQVENKAITKINSYEVDINN